MIPTVRVYTARTSSYERADRLRRRFEQQGYDAHIHSDGLGDVVVLGNGEVDKDGKDVTPVLSYEEANVMLTNLEGRLSLELVVLPHGEGLPLPDYETAGASAMDLRAAIPEHEPVQLLVGQRAVIPTGLSFAIPSGYEVQVRGRSGLAVKHGIGIVNGLGTIDSDYRGELCVILINHGQAAFVINRGDRIAQMVVAPVAQARWKPVEKLSETARGAGGFGSSGVA